MAVDNLPRQPLDKGYFPDWFLSIDRLSKLDYLYLIDGQGNIGNRNDAKEHEFYLRELHSHLRRAMESGASEQQMLDSIKMAKYQKTLIL